MSKVEIWFRGEGAGVNPAKPGGHLHDFGDGMYLTDREDVAKVYAERRAPTPKDQRVWTVAFERLTLGRVLDLTLDPRWTKFMNSKDPMLLGKTRLEYLRMKHELYEQFFKEFLKLHKININNFEVVIGPEYNLGGKQLCILHKNGHGARLAARIRALFRPVTAVARWTVSTALGIPSDISVSPPRGTMKIRIARVVGGSIVGAGVLLVMGYLLSKWQQNTEQSIIEKEIKSFEPEIEKTVEASKGFVVHVQASGKTAYAVVTVIVEYWHIFDELGTGTVQSIPRVTLDRVIVSSNKVESAGNSYSRDPSHSLRTTHYPFTFSIELTMPSDVVSKYKLAMDEYKWYEDVLQSKALIPSDLTRLEKEKEILKQMIQDNFY